MSHHHVRRTEAQRLSSVLPVSFPVRALVSCSAEAVLAALLISASSAHLNEAGIYPDIVGGCSQGAFVAALYALHLNADDMTAPLYAFAQRFTPVNYLSGLDACQFYRISQAESSPPQSKASLGTWRQIEDLWINFFCVSTNVRRSDAAIHRAGSSVSLLPRFHDAVRTSTARD